MSGFSGRLTAAPEGREAGDSYVVRFTIATNDSYVKDGQRVDAPPVFTRVEYWGEWAREFARHAKQGTPVVLIGRWAATEWTDEKSGEKRRRQFVKAAEVGIQPVPAKTTDGGEQEAPTSDDATPTGDEDVWQ